MRFALAMLIAAAPIAAQPNIFEVYPDGTNTSTNIYWRAGLGSSPGEVLQGYPERIFRGVGDAGTTWLGAPSCTVEGMVYEIADLNAATIESYGLVLRNGPGAPVCGPPGEILVVGPLSPPPGVGFTAWSITTTFSSVTIPCDQDWYAGIRFNQNSPIDLLQVGGSNWYIGPGDNPQPNSPSFAWQHPVTCGPVPVPRHTLHVGVLTECSVLNIGADHPGGPAPDPGYGMAGVFPIVSRPDGVCARIRDFENIGGTAQLYLSFPGVSAGFIPGLSLAPLLKGSLHMAGFTLIGTATIPSSGEVTICHPCFVPLGFCMAPTVTWEFQAITFGISPTPKMSNAQRTVL